jgi:hypothetical protein
MKNAVDELELLAGIQYLGEDGVTQPCKRAIVGLLQEGERVTTARILTQGTTHAFLLIINPGWVLAIKSGFSSGYGGEGPRGFSRVLQLLFEHGAEMLEYEVDESFMQRLACSALTVADVRGIEKTRPIGGRWADYVSEQDWARSKAKTLWDDFPLVIPLAIVDPRIIDLAHTFWEAPNDRLLSAWRRLEEGVRKRISSSDHGAKLFAAAFLGPNAQLRWPGLEAGEQAARAELFRSAYGTFRNPRAHRELEPALAADVSEFLIINQLYRLEAIAVPSDGPTSREPSDVGST